MNTAFFCQQRTTEIAFELVVHANIKKDFHTCLNVKLTLLPLATTLPLILSLRRGVIAWDHRYLASPERINRLRAGKCSSFRTGVGAEVASLGASAGSLYCKAHRLVNAKSQIEQNQQCIYTKLDSSY